LGSLSSSKALLEEAIPAPRAAQSFDIGDEGKGGEGDGDGGWEGSEWSESHDVQGWADGDDHDDGGRTGQVGDGQGHASGQQYGHAQDECMGTGEWWDAPCSQWNASARWQACGHGKWSRADWADAWEEEYAEDRGEPSQPAPARRRLEPAEAEAAPKGPGDAAAAETGDAAQQRRKLYEARVGRIMRMAIDAGVQPITSTGEELHLLDPHRLDEWVSEHLPAAMQE
jgi:hypothetical protein